jgi:hypothetical protein
MPFVVTPAIQGKLDAVADAAKAVADNAAVLQASQLTLVKANTDQTNAAKTRQGLIERLNAANADLMVAIADAVRNPKPPGV